MLSTALKHSSLIPGAGPGAGAAAGPCADAIPSTSAAATTTAATSAVGRGSIAMGITASVRVS
uniref:Uncharacterized protein n=1 Tax=Zea mays TaxID=4577 RepID=C4J624_MAIZE|nr:unknown [Zea mays]